MAGGAAAGATASALGGVMNGGFSWEAVLQGAVLGGIGGAATFGATQLAQSAATSSVTSAGGTATQVPASTVLRGPQVMNLGNTQFVVEGAGNVSGLIQGGESTFNAVRTAGRIVQGGLMAELGGGDFGDGALGALGTALGQGAGALVSDGLDAHVDPNIARFAGGVVGAGVTSQLVDARGGDGDLAFLNGVVDTAVSYLPPVRRGGGQTDSPGATGDAGPPSVGGPAEAPAPTPTPELAPDETAGGTPSADATPMPEVAPVAAPEPLPEPAPVPAPTQAAAPVPVPEPAEPEPAAAPAATTSPPATLADVQALGSSTTQAVAALDVPAGDATNDSRETDPNAAFRATERAYRDSTQDSVAGRSHQAQAGDSISRILGTSDPAAVGAFMRANNLSSSTLHAGRTYFVPDDVNAYGDATALGQAALAGDNARLARLAEQRLVQQQEQQAQQQAQWDAMRTGGWSGRTGDGVPVWHDGAQANSSVSTSGMSAIRLEPPSSPQAPGVLDYALGAGELLYAGAHNQAVRIASGVVSIPYAIHEGVDIGVAVQNAFRDRLGYTPSSDGASAILGDVAPVATYVQDHLIDPARNLSERTLGDAATTVIGAGLQAGVEIVGTVAGLRTVGSVAGAALDPAMRSPIAGSRAAQRGGVDIGPPRGEAVSGAAGAAELDWTRMSPRTGGTAADHVMENHGSLSLTKPNQGVFYGDPVETLSDAWRIAQQSGVTPVTVGNRDIYVVPRPNSGYAGGMGGQLENFDHVTLITEAGTTRVVTGYPSGGTPPLPKGYSSLFGGP